jgi:hypothetical protein
MHLNHNNIEATYTAIRLRYRSYDDSRTILDRIGVDGNES